MTERLFKVAPAVGKAAEKAWQETLFGPEGLFPMLGWACTHVYPLRSEHGWRTPISVRGATPVERSGYPDWVCLRRRYIVAVEIKGYDKNGRPTPFQPGQKSWLARFAALTCGRAWVIRPTDPWETIVRMVRFPHEAPRIYGWDPDPDGLERLT